ncbi:MAG TPA: Flp pilus assembly protein CpaB [Tepidisphaeraceae bacterium]|nr:Flp pilus assembly protein CpaB [Tepidisphaeraceae bacterium]
MKLAVAGLCVLGLIAALCAAFLIATLGAHGPRAVVHSTQHDPTAPEVVVLFATRRIAAMTVIDGSMVSTKTMPRDQAPKGFISSPVGVVGKIAATPVAESQPFTDTCFAEGPGPRQLADVIPKGKRAVGISVSDYAGLEGLLYPGSMVDVMASFKQQGNSNNPAMSKTLLENVQVLAFEQLSVVSPTRVGPDVEQAAVRTSGSRRVTLLVDSYQAKLLQLAMEQATLSLALRNPLDEARSDNESVSVQSLTGLQADPPPQAQTQETPQWGRDLAAAVEAMQKKMVAAIPATQPTTRPADPVAEAPKPPPHWDTMVIRGETSETVSFPITTPAARPGDKTASGAGTRMPVEAASGATRSYAE